MPIETSTRIRVFDQEEFHALDRRVMAVVFAVHNEFGRLLDEAVYKNAIASRCIDSGIEPAEQEVRVRVTHRTFVRDYFMDLLCGGGMMLEAKAVETIVSAHRAQSLNYLLLAGLKHGKLVNLRPERVQYEFLSTTLDPAECRRFTVFDNDWREPAATSRELRLTFIELVRDWGAFLEVNLYRDAVIHLLNGSLAQRTEIEIHDGSRVVGHQRVHLLSSDTAIRCTAITHGIQQMHEHQRRFLTHTRLRHLQWINLNHARIEFRTVSK